MVEEEKFDEELEEKTNEEEKDEEVKEVGIFDEDLELADVEEDVSDFSIGDTILSSASSVSGRQGHNLEELAGRKKPEDSKWNDSSEFDREENFYETSKKTDGLYQNGNNNQNPYSNGNDDLYRTGSGDLYSGENNKNAYDVENVRAKSYGELVNNRRSGRSMLEISGFEDKEKQKLRDMRGLMKHERKED